MGLVGADISLVVERMLGSVEGWDLAERPGPTNGTGLGWYDDRSYECFSLLTGLDFSARLVRPVAPVAELRGFPEDLSSRARALLDSWSDDTAFGQSWLDVGDLRAFDWDELVSWTYMTSPPDGLIVTSNLRRDVADYVRRNGWPPDGWKVAGWLRNGFEVTGLISRRRLAGRFLDVVEDMETLARGDPRSVRCVFEFTR
jgi:hypothetical protein